MSSDTNETHEAMTTPHADILQEAERVLQAARERGIVIRLMGGVGVGLRCPGATAPGLKRSYRDLDFVGLSKQRAEIIGLFTELGYDPDRSFNTLSGHQRLLFWDKANGRQVDLVLDQLRMSHTFDFRDRISEDERTVPLAELLLYKLQIVEANQKDIIDIITLLGDHPLGEGDGEMINAGYIARVAADDWGVYRTLQKSLERVAHYANGMTLNLSYPLDTQIARLLQRLETEPKTRRWKLRARIGERMKWYELPEEVRE